MNLPNFIYKMLDFIIVPVVGFLIPQNVISQRLNKECEYWKEEPKDYYLKILGTLHDRASSMVSHLSLMLGICLFLLQQDQLKESEFWERTVVITDSIVCIFLVLLSIRCIKSIGLERDYAGPTDYMVNLKNEISFKYCIIQIINSFTMVATIALVVALLFSIAA